MNEAGNSGNICAEAVPSKVRPIPNGPRVYFIREGNAIKIGFSEQVEKRLSALQTGHHAKLELIGTIPTDVHTELTLHRRFKHLRITGEWFRADKALLDFINDPFAPPPVPEPDNYARAADDFLKWTKQKAFDSPALAYAATRIAYWLQMLKNGSTPERLAGLKEAQSHYERLA